MGFFAKASKALVILTVFSITPILYAETVKEYGIVLLLQDKCTQKAVELNKQLAQALPKLENVKNNWHVTLYHGAYTPEDMEKIYAKLRQMKLAPLKLNFTRIYTTADRWVDWEVIKTPELQKLHADMVQLGSPYHKRPLQRASDVYKDSPVEKQKQIDQYGVAGLLHL